MIKIQSYPAEVGYMPVRVINGLYIPVDDIRAVLDTMGIEIQCEVIKYAMNPHTLGVVSYDLIQPLLSTVNSVPAYEFLFWAMDKIK